MCFKCGTHLYLSGKMIRNCSKCQASFVDHRYNVQYRMRMCICLPLMLPGWILYVVASTVMAILSGCFCCCFGCGAHARDVALGETRKVDPWLGIRKGFVTLFLPFIVFLRDMGIECGCLDGFVEPPLEIPSLTVSSTTSEATTPTRSYGSMDPEDSV
jgi:hypothetical protein